MNLVSSGTVDAIMYGTPSKTLWVSSYKQITNFGMQNFRVDFEGLRTLQHHSETTLTFKVPRYGDLLKDTFLVLQLPDIYSPVAGNQPYEFQWIKHIGAMVVHSIKFTVGGALIQQLSGLDILAFAARDLNQQQFNKWCDMVGHVDDVFDPAAANGFYPNAIYHDTGDSEPSIRQRQLRIPLPIWWGQNTQQAFPLLSMNKQVLQIEIILRPIDEWYRIRDVTNLTGNPNNVIAPMPTVDEHQLYHFLQSPPATGNVQDWFSDIHLSMTYVFLTDQERTNFIMQPQSYLIREVHDTWFLNTSLTDKLWLKNCNGMVLGWCVMMQRSDVASRNEWSNFTNWPYDTKPYPITPTTAVDANGNIIYETGVYAPENQRDILTTLGISIDGSMREEQKQASLFQFEQQFLAIHGNGFAVLPGLFVYQFTTHSSPFYLQPSGAMNMAMYSKIELMITANTPPSNPNYVYQVICDPITGAQLGAVKPTGTLYSYNYNAFVVEERYNMVQFNHGYLTMLVAR